MEYLQEKFSVVKDENSKKVWFYTSVVKRLFYKEKISYSEFARRLGTSDTTAKRLLHGYPVRRDSAYAIAEKMQSWYEQLEDEY